MSDNETTPGEGITLAILTEQLQLLRNDIAGDIASQKDEIIKCLQKENAALKSELQSVKDELAEKTTLIVDIERDVVDLQQYIRRNNIEICGIPNSIEQKDLEDTVIKIADAIDVKITKNEIEACHRLANKKDNFGPKKTIVRFVNRKKVENLHRNKKKLSSDRVKNKLQSFDLHDAVYVNSNLCPYNKYLWGKCKRLHENKLIDRFWVYNGFIHIAIKENDPGFKVNHFSKLEEEFPQFNFNR